MGALYYFTLLQEGKKVIFAALRPDVAILSGLTRQLPSIIQHPDKIHR